MDILGLICQIPLSTILIGVVVFILTFLYSSMLRPKDFPPGPFIYPLVGNLLQVFTDHCAKTATEMHQKYGNIISTKMVNRWLYIIGDYELLKEVFLRRGYDFAGRPGRKEFCLYQILCPREDGVISGDYTEQWKKQRNVSMVILRSLGFGKNRLQEIITEETKVLVKELGDTNGKPIDFLDFGNVAITNIIATLLFGERYDHADKEFERLRHLVDEVFVCIEELFELNYIPLLRFLPHYKRGIKRAKYVTSELTSFYMKKISSRKAPVGEPRDFIEGYKQALERDPTFEDMSLQVTDDFFLAGSETTSTTFGWGIYYLVKHPEIQQKVQEELDRVVGKEWTITVKDKENLPYTEAFIAENMRLSSIAPVAIEHKSKVDSEIAGYRIKKGTLIWGNLWAILRNPKVFPEPEVFRPERYIQKDGSYKRHEQIINFSIGRRSCMGEILARQELFLLFTHILQKYTLSVPEGDTHPPPEGTLAFTYRPPKFRVVVAPRH